MISVVSGARANYGRWLGRDHDAEKADAGAGRTAAEGKKLELKGPIVDGLDRVHAKETAGAMAAIVPPCNRGHQSAFQRSLGTGHLSADSRPEGALAAERTRLIFGTTAGQQAQEQDYTPA